MVFFWWKLLGLIDDNTERTITKFSQNVQELTVLDAISARLFMLITTANNLQVITIGNAYLYARRDFKTNIALLPLPAAYRDFTVDYYRWPAGSMLCSLIS
jgi:hypothetical protein